MATDTQLDTLEARGLVRLIAVRPELEYLFRHWLVQDAAYGSLLKQERRDLHARVGEALEELYPERRGELAAVLAMHFEQAGERDKAIEYLVAAGQYGVERLALQEAYSAFTRAAELLPSPSTADDEATRRRRVEVGLGRAQSGYGFLATEEILATLEAIVPEAEALPDPELAGRVHMLVALVRLQAGDAPTEPAARRSLDRMAEIGEQIGDPSLRAMPLALVGMNDVFAGDIRAGVSALEEAVPLLDGRKDSIGAAFARGALAIGYAYLGDFGKAEAAAARAREIAERGDLIAQLDALIAESIVRSAQGQLAEAVPLAQACVERSEESGATACVVASSWVLGDAYHRLGRLAEARDILRRGTEIARIVDRKVWRPTLQAWLGATATALGEAGAGDWDEALATARSIHNVHGEAGILAKRAEAAISRGDLEAGLADYAASATLLEAAGARPSLARTLRGWGEALRNAGRADEAEPILRRALGLFDELGLGVEASVVRTMLTVGGTPITTA
jgi:tetratricopeptide (TPR) repeat protein